jgi:hypothetical protein
MSTSHSAFVMASSMTQPRIRTCWGKLEVVVAVVVVVVVVVVLVVFAVVVVVEEEAEYISQQRRGRKGRCSE